MSEADRLLFALESRSPSLPGLYRTLVELAVVLGVERVVVGVDDPLSGRQFFSSDRQAFPPSLAFRCGALVWTLPSVVLSADFERRMVHAAAAAYRQSHESRAVEEVRHSEAGLSMVRAATARALRYGLHFTLVCLKTGQPGPVAADALRPGDAVAQIADTEFLLILESARDEDVPAILARLVSQSRRRPATFGLVHCPGDGSEPDDLIAQARVRLAHAEGDLTLRAVGSGQR